MIRALRMPVVEANPKMWIQLGEKSWNTNSTLFEIVQQLKSEMARMRANGETLMQEKEGITKSLSDR